MLCTAFQYQIMYNRFGQASVFKVGSSVFRLNRDSPTLCCGMLYVCMHFACHLSIAAVSACNNCLINMFLHTVHLQYA